MKKKLFFLTVLVILAFCMTSCISMLLSSALSDVGRSNDRSIPMEEKGQIKIGKTSEAFQSKDKFAVAEELKNAGFTNVNFYPITDLVVGILTKDGEVKSVAVNRSTDYSKNDYFDSDVYIVINYHTFPGDFCTNGLEHIVVIDEAKDATCTEKGLTEGSHCSYCGIVLVEQKRTPIAHTIVVDPAVEATREHTGLTEGSHCSVCGAIIVRQEETYWKDPDAKPEMLPETMPPRQPEETKPVGRDDLIDGMRPEFKEFIDNYEAFYIEYIALLKEYSENPTNLGLMLRYFDMLGKEVKMAEAIEEMGESEMNEAESLYYLEATARVTKALLECTYSIAK